MTIMKRTIFIKGAKWEYQALSVADFIEEFDVNTNAECHTDVNLIDFRVDKITHGTIRHEVYHAFMMESNINCLPDPCPPSVMEEITAEFLDRDFIEYLKVCNTIARMFGLDAIEPK